MEGFMTQNLPHHEGLAELADRDNQQKPIRQWPFKRVLNGHLIVQIDQFQHSGRIHIPDSAKRKPTTGRVVAKAEGITDIEVGDKILYSQFAGYLLKFEDIPLGRMISYSEVIGVLNDDAPDLEQEGA
jgi:co-chaperonin GroES (HSP10)